VTAAGSGPLVSGGTLALIMAMTGRVTHCDDLGGDGLAPSALVARHRDDALYPSWSRRRVR
jgi:hypothetical protein